MEWKIYLSGEIHSDWRERICSGIEQAGLPIEVLTPVTDHAASDDCGVAILGPEEKKFWHDHKGAKINAIRTRTLITQADIVIVRFGDQYKQWNAAFDAGYCAASATPYITLHDEDIIHPLKEVDSQAMAWAKTPVQVVEILKYTILKE